MAQLVIDVTDAADERLRARAAQGGFSDGASFLAAVIETDTLLVAYPRALVPRSDAEIEHLLLARVNDGRAVPITDEWFDEIRRRAGLPARDRQGGA